MKTSRAFWSLALALLLVSGTQQATASTTTTLDFTVASEFTGLEVGDVVEYEDVDGAGTDARLEVISLVNNSDGTTQDRLRRADQPGTTGIDIALRGFAPPPAPAVSAVFQLKFLSDATDANSNAITLSNIGINVVDIDAGQYLILPTPTSYELSTNPPTKITATVSGANTTFQGPSSFSEDDYEDYWVFARYNTLSSLTFTLGLATGASGGSFILSFEPLVFTAPVSNTSAERSADPEPAEFPAIHLDVVGQIGSSIAQARVLFEGEGLVRGTVYTLELANGTVVGRGEVGRFGYFSETYSPGNLGPGTHQFILKTTAPDGSPMVLSKTVRVGSSGEFLGLTTTSSGPVLAATGPGDNLPWVGAVGLALGVLGTALVAAGYRRSSSVVTGP